MRRTGPIRAPNLCRYHMLRVSLCNKNCHQPWRTTELGHLPAGRRRDCCGFRQNCTIDRKLGNINRAQKCFVYEADLWRAWSDSIIVRCCGRRYRSAPGPSRAEAEPSPLPGPAPTAAAMRARAALPSWADDPGHRAAEGLLGGYLSAAFPTASLASPRSCWPGPGVPGRVPLPSEPRRPSGCRRGARRCRPRPPPSACRRPASGRRGRDPGAGDALQPGGPPLRRPSGTPRARCGGSRSALRRGRPGSRRRAPEG